MRFLKWALRLVLLALAIHLLLPFFAGFGKTWREVQTLTLWLAGFAALAEVMSYLGSGVLMQGLARLEGGRLSMIRGIAITLASASIGLVAAGTVGSSVTTYASFRKSGFSEVGAASAATLKPVFNNLVLIAAGIFGLIHLLLLGDLTGPEEIGFLVMLALMTMIVSALLWGALHPVQLRSLLVVLNRRWAGLRKSDPSPAAVDRSIDQVKTEWAQMRSGGWRRPLVGAVLNIAFDALCLYLLFAAASDRVSIGTLLTAYSLPLLLGKVAFIPGGLGVVEASMVAMFTTLGAVNAEAVVVVLAYRLLSLWIPALIGFLVVVILQRETSQPPSPLGSVAGAG